MVKYRADVDSVFMALAHPLRRSMLEQLRHSSASVSELAKPHDVSPPAITKHLKILERAKLIARTRQGQVHKIELEAEGMRDAAHWINRYRVFWEGQLDNLERFIFNEQLEEQ